MNIVGGHAQQNQSAAAGSNVPRSQQQQPQQQLQPVVAGMGLIQQVQRGTPTAVPGGGVIVPQVLPVPQTLSMSQSLPPASAAVTTAMTGGGATTVPGIKPAWQVPTMSAAMGVRAGGGMPAVGGGGAAPETLRNTAPAPAPAPPPTTAAAAAAAAAAAGGGGIVQVSDNTAGVSAAAAVPAVQGTGVQHQVLATNNSALAAAAAASAAAAAVSVPPRMGAVAMGTAAAVAGQSIPRPIGGVGSAENIATAGIAVASEVGAVGAAGVAAAATAGDGEAEVLAASRKRGRVLTGMESRKRAREIEVKDFLLAVKREYAPTVPLEATRFHLQKGGLSTSNSQIVTLMSLAADHLVANVVHDCSEYRNLRLHRAGERQREEGILGQEANDDDDGAGGVGGMGVREGKMLTNEDLSQSLSARGIFVSDGGSLVRNAGPAAIAAAAAVSSAASGEERLRR